MTKKSGEAIILAGDVGGTNTRLGTYSLVRQRPVLQSLRIYSSRDAACLEDILERFVKTVNGSIDAACIGIAGPVAKGRSQTTNLPWEVSEERLKARFNWAQVRLINDLSATARAVNVLEPEALVTLNRGEPIPQSPIGLIAPGTGLGMALLVSDKKGAVVLSSEGGHSDFAPTSKNESRLWEHLHRSMGHVSVERVLSGPGLVNIYNWLRESGRFNEPHWLADMMKTADPAEVISQTALKKRASICVEALNMFVSIFGATAGNLALVGLTRSGIYIGGGIAPRILAKLQDGLFLESFKNKGRFRELLSGIPVHVIMHEQASLLGAAVCAFEDLGYDIAIA